MKWHESKPTFFFLGPGKHIIVRKNNINLCNQSYRGEHIRGYLHAGVASCNLYASGVPRDPREHVRTHAMAHQARQEKVDKCELERNQEKDILTSKRVSWNTGKGGWLCGARFHNLREVSDQYGYMVLVDDRRTVSVSEQL